MIPVYAVEQIIGVCTIAIEVLLMVAVSMQMMKEKQERSNKSVIEALDELSILVEEMPSAEAELDLSLAPAPEPPQPPATVRPPQRLGFVDIGDRE